MKPVPLFGGQSPIGAVDVAFHPRIDDIIDLKEFRRTHQVTFRRAHKGGCTLAERRNGATTWGNWTDDPMFALARVSMTQIVRDLIRIAEDPVGFEEQRK